MQRGTAPFISSINSMDTFMLTLLTPIVLVLLTLVQLSISRTRNTTGTRGAITLSLSSSNSLSHHRTFTKITMLSMAAKTLSIHNSSRISQARRRGIGTVRRISSSMVSPLQTDIIIRMNSTRWAASRHCLEASKHRELINSFRSKAR